VILAERNTGFRYEMERLVMMFFPGERMSWHNGPPAEGNYVLAESFAADGCVVHRALLRLEGQLRCLESERIKKAKTDGRAAELALGVLLYRLLSAATGAHPPWGILTGVRPVKLFEKMLNSGLNEQALRRLFIDEYLLEPSCVELGLRVCRVQKTAAARIRPRSVSLFISIPFCPGRCRYCSFVSQSVEKARKLIPVYLDRLCEELSLLGRLVRELALPLMTVYIGGGTPTVLTQPQLDRLLDAVEDSFPMENVLEYTLEAGRPDSMDRGKLQTALRHGINRLSVNPQTFNDEVLARMNRGHTGEDILRTYELARSLGFRSINMDLIAGLPGESEQSFRQSLERVMALKPENITVHALALKRASHLAGQGRDILDDNAKTASRMVDFSRRALSADGYSPYYLYRQKDTVGNLENTGYCLPGFESLYNICMMEELHTVLGAGAGAVTRLRRPDGERIARIFNYKYPYEYVERFPDILLRKDGIRNFYEKGS
jgi:oxygen-independent coproporphyrinogen-3 oxidase